MKILYQLVHISRFNDSKLIGFFSTEELAHNTINALKDKAGFCDYVEGFVIYKEEVDKLYWPTSPFEVMYSL